MTWIKQSVAIAAAGCLTLAGLRYAFAFQNAPPQALEQTPEQLQQLVAPIALYPDSLIAQILAAATYPEQIVEAEKWMEKHKDWQGEKLAKEVNKQHWDPSVKALTQFPAVLGNMNQNLAWTSQLGDAYLNQSQQLNQAIQTMRQKAKDAGNLSSNPQQTVTTHGNSIVIQPASPQIVYVPEYDPWLVYGYPIPVWPDWYPWPGLYIDGPGLAFGLGFDIGFFAGFGWGWGHWGYDWSGPGRVVFDHRAFVSRSTTIMNRANFNRGFRPAGGFGDRGFSGMHSGAFSGFDHGGFARMNSFRGAGSLGGFHGGFRGGGRR